MTERGADWQATEIGSDWKTVVLQPDELLLLRPRIALPQGEIERLAAAVPDHLRNRVIVVDPTTFDVMVVRKLD